MAVSIIHDLQQMQPGPNKFHKKSGLSEDLQKIASGKGFWKLYVHVLSQQLQSVKEIQIYETEPRKKLVEFFGCSHNLVNQWSRMASDVNESLICTTVTEFKNLEVFNGS